MQSALPSDPLLLDATRLVARAWARRTPTGIDRVCQAYLRRFSGHAQAVIQHRGAVRTLRPGASRVLFDMLLDDGSDFRRRLTAFAPRALARAVSAVPGATYINVGHTDFDLDSHARWARRHALRSVYLIHDLIPITHHAHCRPHAVRRHRGRVLGALRHGTGIVMGSNAVAQDLRDFARSHRLAAPSVLVAPLAGETLTPGRKDQQEGTPYFLCLGTIESRKNHHLLLDVWQRLCTRMGARTPRLIIVGQWGRGSETVRVRLTNPLFGEHVYHIDRCSDDRLADLMAGARALLMPTMAEGFGLPMAEALSLGIPVIASDLPCFREVGQGIPNLLPPRDTAAWEVLIAGFHGDHPERRRQVAALPAYRPSSWDHHFTRLEAWLPTLSPAPMMGKGADALVPPIMPAGVYAPFADSVRSGIEGA